MKLGFVSSILGKYTFEETVDTAVDMGFKCVEVACWPHEKAARRYAGISHIDVDDMTEAAVTHIKEYCRKKSIEISSLAYYPNTMDSDPEKRAQNIEHLKKVITASNLLGINMVTTFIGRDQNKTVEQNLNIVKEIWPPIVEFAKKNNVKIAIENCPMLFDHNQWPGGQNLMTTPEIWQQVFEIIPSSNFGLNFDPSHFVWQMMDYIDPVYEFKDKIFHIHFKDVKVLKNRLSKVGIMAYPLEYMEPKIPGLGDIDWGKFVSALTDIQYDGYACIEVEDRSFENSDEAVLQSLRLSRQYLSQFVL